MCILDGSRSTITAWVTVIWIDILASNCICVFSGASDTVVIQDRLPAAYGQIVVRYGEELQDIWILADRGISVYSIA